MAAIAVEHKKGKRLFIGTTNMEAQRGVIWDIGAIASSGNSKALELIRKIILASVSVPGIFEPVFIDVQVGDKHYDEIHADGGVVEQVFVYPLKLKRSVIDEFSRYSLDRHLYILRNGKIVPAICDASSSASSASPAVPWRPSPSTRAHGRPLPPVYRRRSGTACGLQPGVYPGFLRCGVRKQLFDPAYMSKLYDVGVCAGLARGHGLAEEAAGGGLRT